MSNENLSKQFKINLARRLKQIRQDKNLNQFTLSRSTGLSQATVSQYEAGNITLDLYSVVRLADALGCSLDYLLGRDTEYNDKSPRGRLFTAFSKLGVEQQGVVVGALEYLVNG